MNASAVSSILEEGFIISTKLSSNSTWHKNIVYNCKDKTIHIPLLDGYLQAIIMVGSGIVLKYNNEYFEYLFEGTVSKIEAGSPGIVTICINKGEEIINTRIYPRYDTYLAGSVKSIWDSGNQFCIINNISFGGMAFLCKYDFDQNEECDVTVYSSDNLPFHTKGKIIRKIPKGAYICYNMQFIEIHDKENRILSNYLAELDKADAALRAHFIKYNKRPL